MKKILFTLLLCLFSSMLLANEEAKSSSNNDNTLEEIQQMKESIKVLSQNLEAMQKKLEEAEERLKQQEAKTSKPAQAPVYQNQNPDISAAVMFRYIGTRDKRDTRRNTMKLDGTELNFTKAISPYTKGQS